MKLPSRHTKLGKVLRVMVGGGTMSAGQVRRRAKLAPDTAVTARIRDLRKMGLVVNCHGIRQLDGKTVYFYRAVYVPKWVRQELQNEQVRAQLSAVASVGVGSERRSAA